MEETTLCAFNRTTIRAIADNTYIKAHRNSNVRLVRIAMFQKIEMTGNYEPKYLLTAKRSSSNTISALSRHITTACTKGYMPVNLIRLTQFPSIYNSLINYCV